MGALAEFIELNSIFIQTATRIYKECNTYFRCEDGQVRFASLEEDIKKEL